MNIYTNPLYQAARASRYAQQPQGGYVPEAPTEPQQANAPQEAAPQEPAPTPVDESTLLQKVGSDAMSIFGGVANLLDTPRAVTNNALTYLPGQEKAKNPFTPLVDPTGINAHDNRVEGRDLLRGWGAVGPNDTYPNFAAGLAFEIATDPTTYIGVGVANRAFKALQKIGVTNDLSRVTKEMASMAGRSSKKVGKWGGKLKVTPERIFEHMENVREDILSKKVAPRMAGKQFKVDTKAPAFDSIENLNEMSNSDKLKQGQWAVVDKDNQYQIYKWDEAKTAWEKDKDLSKAVEAQLRESSVNMTYKSAMDAYQAEMRNMYGIDGTNDLTKPLSSLVSFKLPFTNALSKQWNINDPRKAFDDWIESQPKAELANAAKDVPGDLPPGGAAGGPLPNSPAGSGPAATGPGGGPTAPLRPFSDVPEVNTELNRWRNEAAEVFGEEGTDEWTATVREFADANFKSDASKVKFLESVSFKNAPAHQAVQTVLDVEKGVGDSLSQAVPKNKGVVQFRDGKAVVQAFKGAADYSTLVHETSHVFRRALKKPLLKKAEKEFESLLSDPKRIKAALGDSADVSNVKLLDDKGNWSEAAEEVWGRLYERFSLDGKAPTSVLEEAFAKIKEMMTRAYKIVTKGSSKADIAKKTDAIAGGDVPESVRAVFEEMLGKKGGTGGKQAAAQSPTDALFRTAKQRSAAIDLINKSKGAYSLAKLVNDVDAGIIPVGKDGKITNATLDAIQNDIGLANKSPDVPASAAPNSPELSSFRSEKQFDAVKELIDKSKGAYSLSKLNSDIQDGIIPVGKDGKLTADSVKAIENDIGLANKTPTKPKPATASKKPLEPVTPKPVATPDPDQATRRADLAKKLREKFNKPKKATAKPKPEAKQHEVVSPTTKEYSKKGGKPGTVKETPAPKPKTKAQDNPLVTKTKPKVEKKKPEAEVEAKPKPKDETQPSKETKPKSEPKAKQETKPKPKAKEEPKAEAKKEPALTGKEADAAARKAASEAVQDASAAKKKKFKPFSDLPLGVQSLVRNTIVPNIDAAGDGTAKDAIETALKTIQDAFAKGDGTGSRGQKLSRDEANKVHQLLMAEHAPYKKAFENIDKNAIAKKAADAKAAANEAAKKARALAKETELKKAVDDPDFETMSREEILGPKPKPSKKMENNLLAPNQERHLLRKFNYLKKLSNESTGKKAEELRKQANNVRDEIAEHNEGMVVQAANTFSDVEPNFKDDLIAGGKANLLELIEKFNYTGKTRLYGYAYKTLRYQMITDFNKQSIVKNQLKGDLPLDAAAKSTTDILQSSIKNAEDEAIQAIIDDPEKLDAVFSNLTENHKIAIRGKLGTGDKKKSVRVLQDELGLTRREVERLQKEARQQLIKEGHGDGDLFQKDLASGTGEKAEAYRAARKAFYGNIDSTLKAVLKSIKDKDLAVQIANMLDRGEHLFHSNPALRKFMQHFDPDTLGVFDYEGQEIARKHATAIKRAVYQFRGLLSSVVHVISRAGVLDESQEIAKEIALGKTGKQAREAAQLTLNQRHQEIVRYLENAVDADGVRAPLSEALFGKNTEEIQGTLDLIKDVFPERLLAQAAAGLNSHALQDVVLYFPRFRHPPGKPIAKGERGQIMYDASLDSQRKRALHTKDLPGGRAILDALSVDEKISGIYWDQAILKKGLTQADIQKSVDHILSNKRYVNGILSAKHYKAPGVLNKEGKTKLEQVASAVAHMDPWYRENKIPFYGRNFMHDFAQSVQDSIAKEGVAYAAQDMVAKNISGTKTQYTLKGLFKEMKVDNNQAYVNVIEKVGRRAEYDEFKKAQLESVKEQLAAGKTIKLDDELLKLDDQGNFILVSKADAAKLKDGKPVLESVNTQDMIKPSDDELERMLKIGREFSDAKDLTVSKEAYDTATFYLTPWARPPQIGELRRAMQGALNFFKHHVTIPHPAFHTRNFLSGQVQNFFYGAFDPSVKGGALLGGRYLRPIMQARTMRMGGTVKGLADQLPPHIRQMAINAERSQARINNGMSQDEVVTEWVREQVFRYGLTGDKQGKAAEQIGESVSSLASQMPGAAPLPPPSLRNLYGLLPQSKPGITMGQALNPLRVRGAPTFTPTKDGLAIDGRADTDFYLSRAGESLATATEDLNRISPFLAFLKQGVVPEEAARRVQRIQVDYSTLSETEKKIREIIPFYTFSSRMIPLTLGDVLTHPSGKQAWAIRATYRGQNPNEPAPDHVLKSTALPWGESGDGGRRYISGLGLAYEDALQFSGALQGDWKGTIGEVGSRMRPGAQALAEIASGRSLFFDRDLDDLDPPIGRLGANISDMVTGEERKGNAEPFIGKGTEFTMAKLPLSRYVNTMTKLTDQRKNLLYRMANAFTGVKVTDVSPESQDYINIDRWSKALKERGGREMAITYVPEWAQERLDDQGKAETKLLQSFISEVQKRGRERKKEAEGLAGSLSGVAGD